jgi:hypothetical protein
MATARTAGSFKTDPSVKASGVTAQPYRRPARNEQGYYVNAGGMRTDSYGRPLQLQQMAPPMYYAAPQPYYYPQQSQGLVAQGTSTQIQPASVNQQEASSDAAGKYPTYPEYPNQYKGIPAQSFEQFISSSEKNLRDAGNAPFLQLMNEARTFNVDKPYSGYQAGFEASRKKAYDEVMSEFNRTNQEEFAEFQQRMADQGLDPNSGAYKAQYRAYKDQQDRAKLGAQAQAAQQAYQVQQQAYAQAQGAYNQFQELAKTGLIPQQTMLEIQGKLAQQAAANKADLFKAQINARASLDVAGATKAGAAKNPTAAGITGSFAQGLLSGIGSGIARTV